MKKYKYSRVVSQQICRHLIDTNIIFNSKAERVTLSQDEIELCLNNCKNSQHQDLTFTEMNEFEHHFDPVDPKPEFYLVLLRPNTPYMAIPSASSDNVYNDSRIGPDLSEICSLASFCAATNKYLMISVIKYRTKLNKSSSLKNIKHSIESFEEHIEQQASKQLSESIVDNDDNCSVVMSGRNNRIPVNDTVASFDKILNLDDTDADFLDCRSYNDERDSYVSTTTSKEGISNKSSFYRSSSSTVSLPDLSIKKISRMVSRNTNKAMNALISLLRFGKHDYNDTGGDTKLELFSPDEILIAKSYLVRKLERYIMHERCLVLKKGMHLKLGSQLAIVTELLNDKGKECAIALAVPRTQLNYDHNDRGEFSKVYLAPFFDTLPDNYELDLTNDCVRPFLQMNPLIQIFEGMTFSYNGIQLKVFKTVPSSRPVPIAFSTANNIAPGQWHRHVPPNKRTRRIGVGTEIFIGKPTLPHWIDILSAEHAHVVMSLPSLFHSKAIVYYLRDVPSEMKERIYTTLILSNCPVESVKSKVDAILSRFETNLVDANLASDQRECAICLAGLVEQQIIKLNCNHYFHSKCLANWLVRSELCPLCKKEIIV